MDKNNQELQKTNQNGSTGMDPKVASCLCYLCGWITGLIFLLIEKENKEVQFHAWHSIFINIFIIVISVLSLMLTFIPYMGFLFGILNLLIGPAALVLMIINMLKAYQGSRLTLPYITELAEKQVAK